MGLRDIVRARATQIRDNIQLRYRKASTERAELKQVREDEEWKQRQNYERKTVQEKYRNKFREYKSNPGLFGTVGSKMNQFTNFMVGEPDKKSGISSFAGVDFANSYSMFTGKKLEKSNPIKKSKSVKHRRHRRI